MFLEYYHIEELVGLLLVKEKREFVKKEEIGKWIKKMIVKWLPS